jgi:hypothetical protein
MFSKFGMMASSITFPQLEVLSGSATTTLSPPYYYTKFTTNGTFQINNAPLGVRAIIVGGGGGGMGALGGYGQWYSAEGSKDQFWGPGGAAGGILRETNLTLYDKANAYAGPSRVFTVTIGAGGSRRSNGGTTTLTLPNSYGFHSASGGDTPYGYNGGSNADYSGANGREVQLNNGLGGYPPYQPAFMIGGGGAGAGRQGVSEDAGGPMPATNGEYYGAGAPGVGGGYYGGMDYWGYTWNTYFPSNIIGTSYLGSGSHDPSGYGGNAPANYGGAGGTGLYGGGSGGSGVLILRYHMDDVGRMGAIGG